MSIPRCTHKKHKKKKKKKKSLAIKQLTRKLESSHATNSKTAPLTSSFGSIPDWKGGKVVELMDALLGDSYFDNASHDQNIVPSNKIILLSTIKSCMCGLAFVHFRQIGHVCFLYEIILLGFLEHL